MKKTITILFFIVCTVIISFGQTSIVALTLEKGNIIKGEYSLYSPIKIIRAIYKDTISAKNLIPEQLMTSILSSNSKEWEKYNSLEFDNDVVYEPVNNQILNYELISTFNFQLDSLQMAIVKFRLVNTIEKKAILGITIMQRDKIRWKTTSSQLTTKISTLFLVFKDEVLQRILNDKPLNGTEMELLKNIKVNNGFLLEKLLNQNFNDTQKKYFINPLNW